MLSTQKMPQTVQECIEILAYNEHFWEGFHAHEKDRKTIGSLADTQYPWTEKQAMLGLRIIKRYKTLFEKYKISIDDLCNDPQWRDPFRKIDYAKVLEKFTNENNEDQLEIRFPYSEKMIGLIRCLKDKRGLPAGYFKYDGETKKWTAKYSDVVAYYMTLIGTRYDFEFADKTMFDDFYEIREEKRKFKHIKVNVGKKNLGVDNAPESLVEYWKSNIATKPLLQQVDSLKTFGLSIPIGTDKVTSLAEKIAVTTTKEVHVSPEKWNKTQVLSACEELNLFPIICPVSDLSSAEDIQEMTNWFFAFAEREITDKQVAWGFDLAKYPISDPLDDNLSNDNMDSFDDPYSHLYTREMTKTQKKNVYNEFKILNKKSEKNKFIGNDTKIIFIRNKIPRTLLKSGVRPTTTLSFISNSYAPYGETVRKWLDNIQKRLYYSTYTNYGSAIDKI